MGSSSLPRLWATLLSLAPLRWEWWLIRLSPFFDAAWYRERYPDVAHLDPALHYLERGGFEGRDPSPHFSSRWYLEHYPDVRDLGLNPLVHYLRYGRKEGRLPKPRPERHFPIASPLTLCALLRWLVRHPREGFWILRAGWRLLRERGKPLTYAEWITRHDTLSPADRRRIRRQIARLAHRPKISLLLRATSPRVHETIASVQRQLYPDWELCITALPALRHTLQEGERVKVALCPGELSLSEALNRALELAEGQFLACLEEGDLLAEHALYLFALELNRFPESELLFSDEDRLDERGGRLEPDFKPDLDPDLLLGQDFIGALALYRTERVRRLGGFRGGELCGWDLALRVVAEVSRERVRHLPFVLYHRRGQPPGSPTLSRTSTPISCLTRPSSPPSTAPKGGEAARMLEEHLRRLGTPDKALPCPSGWRILYPLPSPEPLVTAIVPTRDKVSLLARCLKGLEQSGYPNLEILVVDNGSSSPESLAYLKAIANQKSIRVLPYPGPFNFSRINNFAAKEARGELLLFLNNDVEASDRDWLFELVRQAVRPEVGAVGAKLLYPDGTIQHAGMVLGLLGTVGHLYRGFPGDFPGPRGRLGLVRSVSAVTGACLMVRREVFEAIGGFEEQLAVAFNDVDLCLRIREAGYRIVWTPFARLCHMEGETRGRDALENPRFLQELALFHQKWWDLLERDPAYNPNLTLAREDGSLADPPRLVKPWRLWRLEARSFSRNFARKAFTILPFLGPIRMRSFWTGGRASSLGSAKR